jgi:hypothetical protein
MSSISEAQTSLLGLGVERHQFRFEVDFEQLSQSREAAIYLSATQIDGGRNGFLIVPDRASSQGVQGVGVVGCACDEQEPVEDERRGLEFACDAGLKNPAWRQLAEALGFV